MKLSLAFQPNTKMAGRGWKRNRNGPCGFAMRGGGGEGGGGGEKKAACNGIVDGVYQNDDTRFKATGLWNGGEVDSNPAGDNGGKEGERNFMPRQGRPRQRRQRERRGRGGAGGGRGREGRG